MWWLRRLSIGQRGQNSLLVGIPDVAVPKKSLLMPEVVRQGYLEIRDMATSEVVTVMEVLSPTNKRPGEGRRTYEAKRQTVLASPTNLVEIDLLRQ